MLLVSVLLAAACTSGDSTPATTSATTPGSVPSTAANSQPDAGGDTERDEGADDRTGDSEPSGTPDDESAAEASAAESQADVPSPTTLPPPEDPIAIPDLPGSIAVLAPDGDLLIGAAGSLERFVAAPAVGRASQPTWSPDGSHLAYSLATDEGAWVVVTTADGTEVQRVGTPYAAYFLFWTSDGQTLGTLGAGGLGTQFGTMTIGSDRFTPLASGSFFYFDWAPDGQAIVAHEGPGSLVTIEREGERSALAASNAGYQAPEWSADGTTLYAVVGVPNQVSVTGPLRSDAFAQTPPGVTPSPGHQIVAIDVETGDTEVLAEIPFHVNFDISPSGDRMAFASSPTAESVPFGPLDVMDLETRDIERAMEEPVAGFEWSPDSSTILAMTVQPGGLGWHTLAEERVDHDVAPPSNLFLIEYFQFWNQYARTLTLWAPDGSGFIYPVAQSDGGSQIWVQRLDGTPAEFVADGEFAVWGP